MRCSFRIVLLGATKLTALMIDDEVGVTMRHVRFGCQSSTWTTLKSRWQNLMAGVL